MQLSNREKEIIQDGLNLLFTITEQFDKKAELGGVGDWIDEVEVYFKDIDNLLDRFQLTPFETEVTATEKRINEIARERLLKK